MSKIIASSVPCSRARVLSAVACLPLIPNQDRRVVVLNLVVHIFDIKKWDGSLLLRDCIGNNQELCVDPERVTIYGIQKAKPVESSSTDITLYSFLIQTFWYNKYHTELVM